MGMWIRNSEQMLTMNSSVSKNDSVKMVARRLKVKAGVSLLPRKLLITSPLTTSQLQPEQQVRISFLGKMLDEKKTLTEEGWKEGFVVNAYIFG
jgi:hypothetical protein